MEEKDLNFPWAGNARERAAKARGFGLYASHIGNPGNIYMRRFVLLLPLGFTIRVHQIMRSDDDRHLHDHPFSFISFLLSGGYFETLLAPDPDFPPYIEKVTRWVGRFSFNWKMATEQHCLSVTRPVWTLVFAMPKSREWGFHTERGWIHNEVYFDHFPKRAEWKDMRPSA